MQNAESDRINKMCTKLVKRQEEGDDGFIKKMEAAFEPVRANLTLIKHILCVSHVLDEGEEGDKDTVSLIGRREKFDSPNRPRTRDHNSP